ncbi:MAG TPA: cupin domain-containing protein [Thermomicrobiales bacterium]|nr:cupin domain-containing protein [Thermomicrobiales bacterium]
MTELKTAEDVITLLDLQPLPGEGGFFRQTYVRSSTDPDGPPETTAIYYLVTPDSFSGLHRLGHDELFHFYLGDPCEMVTYIDGEQPEIIVLGQDLGAGMTVQHLVPAGTWQGTRLRDGGRFALMGTTMTPGFDPRGFELASPDLLAGVPDVAAEQLSRFLAHASH